MNKKLLLSFALAAAMTGCINDSDVPSENGDNPAPEVKGGNMEISFVVPNSSNGSRAASAEDSGIYDQGTAEEYKVSNVTLYLFDSSSKNLVTTINVAQSDLGAGHFQRREQQRRTNHCLSLQQGNHSKTGQL